MIRNLTIGGASEAGAAEPLEVLNPATEDTLASVPSASTEQVARAVDAAQEAFGDWSALTGDERAAHLRAFADALDAHADALVEILVDDVGTPISLCRALQVATPIEHLRTYARLAAVDRTQPLGPHHNPVDSDSEVAFRPAGVVAAITPYNYPLSMAIAKVGAALAAGCTTVLMPSPQAPLMTLRLGAIAAEAGLPAGVLNILVGDAPTTAALTEHPGVARVSFTGSVPVGRQVMHQAAHHLAGVVLELGGKSAAIITPGTDLDRVVAPLHLRYARNAGQGCQSPTRLLVHRSQHDEFCARSRDVFAGIATGDPRNPATIAGPVISAAHRDRVNAYVDGAVAGGGEIVARGHVPADRGFYTAPTLVGGVTNDASICQEEIFGPVAALLVYDELDEAIAIANDVEFGLAAYVYGDDAAGARALAPRLHAGSVYVNGGGGFRADAPMGGVKSSGMGREIGEWGIREFLEPQHVQWAL